jgi:Rad3-related DNA helicase
VSFEYKKYFPHPEVREAQHDSIEFALDALLNQGKRYVIIEAGTGVGKSAVGLTVAKYIQNHPDQVEGDFLPGSYFLTTQKILQDQYVSDFGLLGMRTVKSSSNYRCKYNSNTNCNEGQKGLRTAEKGGAYFKTCTFNCTYKKTRREFLDSQLGVTNFPYFITEATYSGKITPREVLVVDEAHNATAELSKFIEVAITERFVKSTLKMRLPDLSTQFQLLTWIKDVYYPKLSSHLKHVENMLEKYEDLKTKLTEFINLARKLDLIKAHCSKIERFLEIYDKNNWVMNLLASDGKRGRKIEFKPIDVSQYSEELLFRLGRRVVLMTATILDKKGFCETLGIPEEESAFISIPSPFPISNRPIITAPIGRMSAKEIESTLPKMANAVREILKEHKNDKGIIHCHTFRIANYLKRNVKSKRLLIHDHSNRDEILSRHINSVEPTVLLSPSMTEGIDLGGDKSRFQILCKIPYPYLGDKLVKKRMNKWKWWYPLQTAKTIVQSTGRSIRSMNDHAVTYILDADWDRFYDRNRQFFPREFKDRLQ